MDPPTCAQIPIVEAVLGTTVAALTVDFDAIYEGEFAYVWNCLRRLGIAEKDLEDACHDVFVVVHRHLHRYDASRPLKPWLCGIAHRVAANHRRKAPQRREVAQNDFSQVQDESPSVESAREEAQERRMVHHALDALDESKRTVMVLHDLQGHSIPEIALLLQEPEGTLYSRLRSARLQFTQSIRRMLGMEAKP